jgi:hypothetical protein
MPNATPVIESWCLYGYNIEDELTKEGQTTDTFAPTTVELEDDGKRRKEKIQRSII